MKISIIIPAYNCERFIERCLDSVLSQSGAELDVIVVNDGSTDNTGKILEKYNNKVHIKTTKNSGSASARTTGIKMAKGDFIMFLDSDDYLAEGAIEKLVEIEENTDADIIKFRYILVFPDGQTKVEENQFDTYDVIEKKDFKEKIYPYFINGIRLNSVCTGMYKRTLIEGRSFRSDMKVAEDAVFSLKTYTMAEKVVFTPDILYNYYQTGAGLTGSGVSVLEKYKYNFMFAKETVSCLKNWGMNNAGTKLRVYLRPVLLTFDKIRRIKESRA